MDFHLASGNLVLTPLTYCHLLNMVDVFVRPQADSGDETKLKYNERQHIFENAMKMDFVRKRGNNLHYWYDYVAVASGSYIYFYPISNKMVEVVKNKTKEKGQINYMESVDYEEYFLLKGCNRVENYAQLRAAQRQKQG